MSNTPQEDPNLDLIREGKYLEHELFICDCEDLSHQFVITYCNDTDDPSISVSVKLTTWLAWYKRLWVAIKYIFKPTTCRFGEYDEIILKPSDAERLQVVVNKLKALKNKGMKQHDSRS